MPSPGSNGHRLDTLKTRRLLGGMTITQLAKAANVSDLTIVRLEAGGNCTPTESARIINALAPPVALTSNTQASPTVFTSATHLFQTGDTALIAGVAGANADPNGSRVVTRVDATSFSVPVNCGTAGGTGGTATNQGASVTLVSLS
jgi:DNA-binding XRE family transcriptional regulator